MAIASRQAPTRRARWVDGQLDWFIRATCVADERTAVRLDDLWLAYREWVRQAPVDAADCFDAESFGLFRHRIEQRYDSVWPGRPLGGTWVIGLEKVAPFPGQLSNDDAERCLQPLLDTMTRRRGAAAYDRRARRRDQRL